MRIDYPLPVLWITAASVLGAVQPDGCGQARKGGSYPPAGGSDDPPQKHESRDFITLRGGAAAAWAQAIRPSVSVEA